MSAKIFQVAKRTDHLSYLEVPNKPRKKGVAIFTPPKSVEKFAPTTNPVLNVVVPQPPFAPLKGSLLGVFFWGDSTYHSTLWEY